MRNALPRIKTWVFDLDNTLYPETSDLFPQVEKLMGKFIVQKLGVSEYMALYYQKTYFANYGTTLAGLMRHHGVDPNEYMDYVHNIDYTIIPANPALNAILQNMPAKKVIYTNGSVDHAHKVLFQLGIDPKIFDYIFDVSHAGYIPKPAPQAFDKVFAQFDIDFKSAAMVEDIAKNLVHPKNLGMTTILMKSSGHLAMDLVPYIDYIHDDIAQLLQYVG